MSTQRIYPLKDRRQWLRVLFMLLYAVVLYLNMWVMGVVVLVQLVFKLTTGSPQSGVAHFAADLTTFINQILRFLTYQSETRPYPFNPLSEPPTSTVDDDVFTTYEVVDDDNLHNPR